jgi:hypothetical protein
VKEEPPKSEKAIDKKGGASTSEAAARGGNDKADADVPASPRPTTRTDGPLRDAVLKTHATHQPTATLRTVPY